MSAQGVTTGKALAPSAAAPDDWTAIFEGAAIGAVAPRAQIAVAGRDRATFLQGLLTNDIPALTPGSGCYSAWLTPQGRMLTDLHVFQSEEMILLDVPAAEAEATLQRLDQFLFSEDVQLQSLSGALVAVSLHGPIAGDVLARVITLGADAAPFSSWIDHQHRPLTFGEAPVVVARIDQLGVPGFCVFADPAHAGALTAALEQAGARWVSPSAIEAARVTAGYPVFGLDMTTETIPLEAGIEEKAISFSKGCYVGQEVIIRVLHRGGGRVAKKLVALRIHGEAPASGAAIAGGGKTIGVITTSALSPSLGAIALGYVHRDFVAPDTAVEIETPAGRVPATVTTRPIR